MASCAPGGRGADPAHERRATSQRAGRAERSDLSPAVDAGCPRRAGDYVTRYHLAMESVIAEERYTQTLKVHATGRANADPRARVGLRDRRAANSTRHRGWRFATSSRSTARRSVAVTIGCNDSSPRGADVDRAMAINRESARYNLGTIVRTINTPTVALDFLVPDTQPRFSFLEYRRSAHRQWRKVGHHLQRARPADHHQNAAGPERRGARIVRDRSRRWSVVAEPRWS